MHKGFTIWLTGMSGAGKSSTSKLLEKYLRDRGANVEVLDGDVVRTYLSKGLGFSKEDRDENIRRIGFVCELLSRNGVIAIAAVISPYRAAREKVRERIPDFIEVYLECPSRYWSNAIRRVFIKRLWRARSLTSPAFQILTSPHSIPKSPFIPLRKLRKRA